MKCVLVAGVGNVFLSDDAFGVEVAQRLQTAVVPSGVRVVDFGIRSLHLAYELLEGDYDLTLLVDATQRGGAPGTLYVIEPDLDSIGAAAADAHTMTPEAVFASLRALGGTPGRVLVVGCEPVSVDEGMGLSAEVSAAVGEGVKLVLELLARECTEGESHVPGDSRPDRAVVS